MVAIYNSFTRKKEPFTPIEPNKIRMYVCGMTVYDFCHIGHGRVMVVFDMVSRYLRGIGFDVLYVRNITDIDDKIIDRANSNDESITNLTNRFIEEMNEDANALGVLPPDLEPKATEHMKEIIEMISQLIKKEHAYLGSNGDVFFNVGSFNEYGKLSGKNLEELRSGERVEIQKEKNDPLDFVLWKSAKKGEPSWPSPWGDGRPGWHIECSAMSVHCLGSHFDIHGGGQDLQFPHHENEIAQSVCSTGGKFASVWMHNGFVRVDEEKMSKSLGNFFTIKEVLKKYQPEVIRFFILSSHYRSPLNYSVENLDEAKSALTRLYTALKESSSNNVGVDKDYLTQFNSYMDDDFNTPKAISLLHEIAKKINRNEDKIHEESKILASTLKKLASILGLLESEPQDFLKGKNSENKDDVDTDHINDLIRQRNIARDKKDFEKADEIRRQLAELDVTLEDTEDSTDWRRS
ncbi:MAG: cysteine--tRNA ligase [Pseudomonadota bacterium]|nr:cysteine--tRNA ligase [Pseudomonadota bacterium]